MRVREVLACVNRYARSRVCFRAGPPEFFNFTLDRNARVTSLRRRLRRRPQIRNLNEKGKGECK